MFKFFRIFSRRSFPQIGQRFQRSNSSNSENLLKETNLGRDSRVPDVYNFEKLSKPVSWLPPVEYAAPESNRYETRVTTLENGLKVATEKLFGDFATVGIVISSGARFEDEKQSGVSHFLEKLAFMSTDKYRNRDEIIESLHKINAICDCQTARDLTIYALSCRTSGLEQVIELLSETTFRPKFSDEEIEIARGAIANELDDLHNRRYDPTPILTDMIHKAGFGSKTLGLPKYTPIENIEKIDRTILLNYTKKFYRPDRMVLAGVGVDHENLVELARKYFHMPKPTDIEIPKDEKAVWTGGAVLEERDLSHLSFGADPLPELAHIALGFEAPSHRDEKEFIAACVLSQMMGGGGSFSAGGPGKGLYSRFYTNVLNRYEQVKTAISYNQAYNDSGCLFFHIGGEPEYIRGMVDVAIREIGFLVNYQPDSVELKRAKAQLQSMLFMNLEQRPVVFEDVARQVLAVGKRQSADYYYNRIERIQAQDIQAVAKKVFAKPLAFAALGKNLKQLRSYNQIAETVTQQLAPSIRWRFRG